MRDYSLYLNEILNAMDSIEKFVEGLDILSAGIRRSLGKIWLECGIS